MRVRWLSITAALLVLALGVGRVLDTATPVQAEEASRFAPDRVLVAFRPGTPAAVVDETHRQAGAQVTQVIDFIGLHVVTVPSGTVLDNVAVYRRNPNVRYAEPDYIRSIPKPLGHGDSGPIMAYDYYFDEQYFLHNTGQQFQCIELLPGWEWCSYQATADADIDAPEGWAISKGSVEVRIAVLDTGVDRSHPDLNADGKVALTANFTGGSPADGHGHGTHVSGIAAAETNNREKPTYPEEGVAGTGYNSSLIVGKVCDDNGSCADSDIIDGIGWAILNGAKVLSMSWGDTQNSQAIADALASAWNSGLVLVAAAGNSGTSQKSYPAASPRVIAVGASDEDDNRASFSNYSNDSDDWVTVAAPGNVILSTWPMSGCAGLATSPGDEGCYDWLSGTSMATPIVSGIAALVWDVCRTCTNADVKSIIEQSADTTGAGGQNLREWTKWGRVNLHDALTLAQTWSSSNVAPVATNDSYATNEDAILSVAKPGVLSNDIDADSDPLTASLVTGPTMGAVVLNADGSFTYTPNPNTNGSDSFTYRADDSSAHSNVATVSITIASVNDPPVANNDSATTSKDTAVTVSVLANDSDPDGDALTVCGATDPPHGTVTRAATTIKYTPDSGYTGPDSFSYTISDGQSCVAAASVSVTVKKGNGGGGGGGPRPR